MVQVSLLLVLLSFARESAEEGNRGFFLDLLQSLWQASIAERLPVEEG